ncbi:MAG: beta-galactosidase [Anaerolineae bacterium]|nr:beta-galactosidase [Anaerolineae bacterium]
MTTHVRQHNGTPTLFFNEQPTFAGYLWAGAPTAEGYAMAKVARAYAEAGIHLYAFDVGVGAPEPEWCGPGEGHTGYFDFSTVEARYGHILDVDPDARFHLRIHLEMGGQRGKWWRDLYPEECELDSAGRRNTQSFASTVWREQANTFLRAYIAHLRSLGLDKHVVAYQTGAGHTGEWVKGDSSMWAYCGDYSDPMRHHFRAWLRQTYQEDIAILRTAWDDEAVTFDKAEVPSAEAQLTTTHHTFRDPRHEQRVIDYYRCLADLCGDLIIDFNRTVKEATCGQALAGAFYGYLMELAWNAGFFSEGEDTPYATTQRSGHLGLAKVLRSPYVDFIVSPYSYGFRGMGGMGCAMPPAESLRLHGKLYIFEEDSRTHLAPIDAGFGRADTLYDSIAILKRNFSEVLTRGMGIWWLGHSSHIDPVQEPTFQSLLKQFQELGTFGLQLDRTPGAEIAVLVDDESFYYESLDNNLDIPLIFQQRLWGLPRLGAPSDTYLLQDFIEGRLPPYKLYIFLNTFQLTGERRAALHRELQREGRVALWIYAPGYIQDEPALDNMTKLTGFRFSKGEHVWGPMMHLLDFEHPITMGLPQDLMWGTNSRLGPLFHLEDPDATILGQVVYSQGRCRPGLGVKVFSDWTSIYCAAPNLPAPVLRGIARYAGVHLYSEDGDVLFASRHLLGVHTLSGGSRIFTLPKPVEIVYDLFARQTVVQKPAGHVAQFKVILDAKSTTLYYTGDKETLKGYL